MNNKKKEIVFVLGSTRSGTSLTMQVLHALGMRISDKLLPPSINNPHGNLEDSEIVTLIEIIRHTLGMRIHTLAPKDFFRSPHIAPYKEKLMQHIDDNIQKNSSIWGFKEPRSPELLPLWQNIFKEQNINVKFILCVRDPRHVLSSMKTAHHTPNNVAKLMWLLKNVSTLKFTNAQVFIVHYNDWFENPLETIRKLTDYTGVNRFNVDTIMPEIYSVIDKKLNRSVKNPVKINNIMIETLYTALLDCHGSEFDRDKLLKIVDNLHNTIETFRLWSDSYTSCTKSLDVLMNKD